MLLAGLWWILSMNAIYHKRYTFARSTLANKIIFGLNAAPGAMMARYIYLSFYV